MYSEDSATASRIARTLSALKDVIGLNNVQCTLSVLSNDLYSVFGLAISLLYECDRNQ